MNKIKTYTSIGTVLVAGLLLSGCSMMTFNTSTGSETGGTQDSGNTQNETPGKNNSGKASKDVNDSAAIVNTVNSFYEAVYSLDLQKIQTEMAPELEAFAAKHNIDQSADASAMDNLSKEEIREFINIYKKNLKFNEFVNTPDSPTIEDLMAYSGFSSVNLMGAGMSATGDASYVFDESAVTVDGDTATVDLNKGVLTLNGEISPPASGENNLTLVKEDGTWLIDYVANSKSLFQNDKM